MSAWRIGIVGAEASKFTKKGEEAAKLVIRKLLERAVCIDLTTVVSGECPKGGVDIWARDIGLELLCGYEPHKPYANNWEAYKERNTRIAERSDEIYVITPRTLPNGEKLFCYHCRTDAHVRNGGCWTAHAWNRIHSPKTSVQTMTWHVVENL